MPPWKWAMSTRSFRKIFSDQAEGTRREGDVERKERHVEAVHADAVDLGRAVDRRDHDHLVAAGVAKV